jgi:hypothetical protein
MKVAPSVTKPTQDFSAPWAVLGSELDQTELIWTAICEDRLVCNPSAHLISMILQATIIVEHAETAIKGCHADAFIAEAVM